ncbi:hypothetical protein N3K66_007914 [Trichothecium roseum]|uniref:Uncharacterized protein n=1 Tax=Trichothecium roseum TaxID=47278 RepID=A0ACC0UTQ0_9HYPO|nr:hypothetical protein N3K66_007914 [Trichothecium roseum]
MSCPSFDYVIVGGGLAGLVLATRLSEQAALEVLVVEAGEDQTAHPRVNIPAMWPALLRTDSAWDLKTVPQEGLQGRELGFPQGKLLGGSSALNGLTFSATSKANVDAWESLGNPGWGWSSFSESMKRSYTLASEESETHGPINLTLPEEDSEWPRVWNEALAALGFATTSEPFGGHVLGSLILPDSINPQTKQRSYSANAYLEPARSRANLTIWTKAQAERIIFDSSSDAVVATGVEVTRNGERQLVRARKEIIISAGAIHSPRLLEMSGIGDAKLLEALGIDVVVDNPNVGENLQNHPMCILSFEAHQQPGFETLDKIFRQDEGAVAAAMEAYATKKGPFSRSGSNLTAQLPTPLLEHEDDASKLATLLQKSTGQDSFANIYQSYVHSVVASRTEASACYMAIPGFTGFTSDGWMAPPPPGQDNYFTLAVVLAHPLSRGSVHLTPSSTASPGLAIDPKYLSQPLDLEVMARHLQFAEKMANTKPLASQLKLDGKRGPLVPTPGKLADLGVAKDYLRRTASGAYHFTGTCSMMPRAIGGVVDPQLRVYGCRNLRVCDASVIPLTPRTNPQATVYGVAEHAAQIILGEE